jgi:hypothetical protein
MMASDDGLRCSLAETPLVGFIDAREGRGELSMGESANGKHKRASGADSGFAAGLRSESNARLPSFTCGLLCMVLPRRPLSVEDLVDPSPVLPLV